MVSKKTIELCEQNDGSYTIKYFDKDVFAGLKIIEFGEVDEKFIK